MSQIESDKKRIDELTKEFFTLGDLLKMLYESKSNLKYIDREKIILRRQEIIAEFGRKKWNNGVLKDEC